MYCTVVTINSSVLPQSVNCSTYFVLYLCCECLQYHTSRREIRFYFLNVVTNYSTVVRSLVNPFVIDELFTVWLIEWETMAGDLK